MVHLSSFYTIHEEFQGKVGESNGAPLKKQVEKVSELPPTKCSACILWKATQDHQPVKLVGGFERFSGEDPRPQYGVSSGRHQVESILPPTTGMRLQKFRLKKTEKSVP